MKVSELHTDFFFLTNKPRYLSYKGNIAPALWIYTSGTEHMANTGKSQTNPREICF